jgi:hypothetical protein
MEYTKNLSYISTKVDKYNSSKTVHYFAMTKEEYLEIETDASNIKKELQCEQFSVPIFKTEAQKELSDPRLQKFMSKKSESHLLMFKTDTDKSKLSVELIKNKVYNVDFTLQYFDFNGKKGLSSRLTSIKEL